MKIVFVSNYFNHHQAPFAQAMDELTQHGFTFVETMRMTDERKKMGWSDEEKPVYVKQAYAGEREKSECLYLIGEADAVVWGSCPMEMVSARLKQRKLTFCYSERLFKKGFGPVAFGGRAVKYILKHCRYQKNHYLLCASAYAAADYARIGLFRGRAYKWGYFPAFIEAEDTEALIGSKQPASMLWAGRMIPWKHPEIPVRLARRLKEAGIGFRLDMVGNGSCRDLIAGMIDEYELGGCVFLHDSMQSGAVREMMDRAEIYLFTSDHNEGWGAVANESMNSACALLADRQIGSVPYLIRQGVSGFVYEGEDELFERAKELLGNSGLRRELGLNALISVRTEWRAEIAAERLIDLIGRIGSGSEAIWESGPCSRA